MGFNIYRWVSKRYRDLMSFISSDLYFCKSPGQVPSGSMIFFPLETATLCCGLAGIVTYKRGRKNDCSGCIPDLEKMVETMEAGTHSFIPAEDLFEENYLGGSALLENARALASSLKNHLSFATLYRDNDICRKISQTALRLTGIIEKEEEYLNIRMGKLSTSQVDIISNAIERIKDIEWCLRMEISENILKVRNLIPLGDSEPSVATIILFKSINAVLNSIDRLEVRGRDSSGISIQFNLDGPVFRSFMKKTADSGLASRLKERTNKEILLNNSISVNESLTEGESGLTAVMFTYKIAAEIGSLGDNVAFLRNQIKNDQLLHIISSLPARFSTASAHTRWASIGSITEANCHPVDNVTPDPVVEKSGIIHASLNGDIDNYLELKEEYENRFNLIQDQITTDTKIIPLQVELYLKQGHSVKDAFLMAVNDFEGSHAIAMHTDLAPGKLFLSQRGSGQAIFIGIGQDQYISTSEVYGFVEETDRYIKMDGETIAESENGDTQGQVFILNQDSEGGLDGIEAYQYNGNPIILTQDQVQTTEITSRDIDRQKFDHFFLKEISEAPVSVAKTLLNRWKLHKDTEDRYVTDIGEQSIPESLQNDLSESLITRIFFMGQGTAGVAALACADILRHYINDPSIQISAVKSSELSGFVLKDNDLSDSMTDTLVIAISQSGTTTDTNRTVDMLRARGARTLAIVNRRDSDLTFKVEGTFYTSSGRDIEMSVASTKAFYSQIVAGAVLGLKIAELKSSRSADFISGEIKSLLKLPGQMRKVLSLKDKIRESAARHACLKTYWATVGSGPNKASADEIRIKLSELCYKTISSDFVEDKKHIDLSSEPLILVCAAGTRPTVIGDVVKDTAIFHAHKATPIVIADEGESRFDPYAVDIFKVPVAKEHLAPVLNTLVGHIWGYYAALSINEGSRFFYDHQQDIQAIIQEYADKGLDLYEVVLEKKFREKIAKFYTEFRQTRSNALVPGVAGATTAADLTLLLKYLTGRLPVSDFEFDFAVKGTPVHMIDTLLEKLGETINAMARPVDAIKHQAKTVTVGTSRISSKIEGHLFEQLSMHDISIDRITNSNVIVLKNLQGIVKKVKGSLLYRVRNLGLLGDITDKTTIEVIKKSGSLKDQTSRIETDNHLKGTKSIIVREGNVFVGKGRKDGRKILVIPVISSSSDAPNKIDHLLSLNIEFHEKVSLYVKIKAYGAKLERLKNIVQENSVKWDDRYLDLVEMDDLFGDSAERTGDYIASQVANSPAVN